MWYLVFVPFAIWVYYDATQRKTSALLWAIGTALLGVFVLPLYFAMRPLKKDEVREGGRGWIIVKNFALAWTVLIGAAAFYGLALSSPPASGAGAVIGTVVGVGFLGVLWFVPMVGALVLGLFLKTSSIERGPTGPLAESSNSRSRAATQSSQAAPSSPSSWSVSIQRGFRPREDLRSILEELAPQISAEERERVLDQREIVVASGLSVVQANHLMTKLTEKGLTAQKHPDR